MNIGFILYKSSFTLSRKQDNLSPRAMDSTSVLLSVCTTFFKPEGLEAADCFGAI